jgi:hypothetical protein
MKRILFCATTPMSYAMFKPVHRRLKQDKRIEIWFTANHDPKALYSSVGLENENIISKYRSMLSRYDMCICPSFFYEKKNSDVKVQIFHGCSLKNRAVHKKALEYDKLFLVGPYMRQKFIETWKLPEDDRRFENIGMPKLDAFFDGSLNRYAIAKKLNLDPNLPTVIYAPTRTSVTSSSLQMYGRQIIASVSEMPVNFLVKLHDRAYKQWKPRMKQDWAKILDEYRDHPRLRAVYDYDIVPYLFISDLLISDISSVVNEFSLLDRPMVLIDVPRLISHHKKMELKRGLDSSDLEDWGQSAGYLVKDMDRLTNAVTHCLEHPEEKQETRQEFTRRFFFNPGHATSRAVEKIYELMGLDPPEKNSI